MWIHTKSVETSIVCNDTIIQGALQQILFIKQHYQPHSDSHYTILRVKMASTINNMIFAISRSWCSLQTHCLLSFGSLLWIINPTTLSIKLLLMQNSTSLSFKLSNNARLPCLRVLHSILYAKFFRFAKNIGILTYWCTNMNWF